MQSAEAITFLSTAQPIGTNGPWADLGAGTGVFTRALSFILPGSPIYAIDQQDNLQSGSSPSIQFIQANFITDDIELPVLGGILMGNALHYVKDKKAFIKKWSSRLSAHGQWIIIEYESDKPNQWVPYPIKFEQLHKLFAEAGYNDIQKMADRPSVYNSGEMYVVTINRKPEAKKK